MRVFIRPPNKPSNSARALSQATGIRMLRRRNSRYRYRDGDRLINWGNSQPMDVPDEAWINNPMAVGMAIDKRAAWQEWHWNGVPTVDYTTRYSRAYGWVQDGQRVLVRRELRASQGRGITVHSLEGTQWTDPLPDWDLCTGAMFVKVFERVPAHVTEYRVHVIDGQAVDIVAKRRRREHEGEINPYIRNKQNGWVFCREGIDEPAGIRDAAIGAARALGLDFAAIDLGASRGGNICIYEANTAPGLEGRTLCTYTTYLGGAR